MLEEEVANKFGIDLEKLKKEQLKLAKSITLKDSVDFSSINSFAAISNIIVKNKIISAILVCDSNCEIIEQQYFSDKLRFPYIYGFRSYREMPAIIEAINKLSEKPDVVFLSGNGTAHGRLGIASHFSLLTGIPAIGISDNLFEGLKINEKDEICMEEKVVGKVLQSKENSKPIYVSPGSFISINSAYELAKKFIRPPHKLPEPLHLANKYSKTIKEELGL